MYNKYLSYYVFQELLTKHKMLAADFLEANFDKVFGHYQKLLHSDNYVTRRQSLKLLGELLLDRHNYSVSPNIIEGEQVFSRLAKKVTISKKSTIFVLYSWNLVKITNSEGSHFDQVSWV